MPRLRVGGAVASTAVSRLRVGGAVASGTIPAPRLRVGGAVASGDISAPRLRVGGVIASGGVPASRLQVGGVIASGAALSSGTRRRAPGGEWTNGWLFPGTVLRRVHPDLNWHPVASTPTVEPLSCRLRVGGVVATGIPRPEATGSPAHVIVGLIQSNIRGAATDWDQTDQYNNPLIEMYRWSDGALVPATEPMSTRDAATGMGAMNTFVKAYAADHPGQRIVVVNTARGGTGLTTPATNPAGTAFTWNPDATNDANNLARTSVTAINSIMAGLPSGSKVVAYLANHGSTDGSNGTPKDTFKTLLGNWITFLRTQTNTPTVPYLMMQMRPSLLAENRHNIIDQGQQEYAAANPNAEHVLAPVGSEYANNDSVHFNARGVREIGTRLYQRFASLAGPNSTKKVALIGDSTLNTIGETAMRNALVARGFTASNIWFYARSGKPIILNDDLGKNALVNMAEARAAIGEPDMWVFNLGSNGHRDSRNPDWIGQVLDNAGTAEVLWSGITQVNGYTDGNLSSEATRLAWNDVARPLVQAHPEGRWLDWHAYAKSYPGGDSGWWQSDGVHHTTTGTARKLEFLADLIASPPEAGPVAPRAGITVTEWARPAGALDANPSNFKSVLSSAPSGATLVLAPGTYPGDWKITKPVTIQPAPSATGAKVIVDGQNAATPVGIVSAQATLRGITFRNFNTQDEAKWEHGLMFPSGSSGSIVEHCRFEDFKGTSGNFTRGAIVIFNRGSITIRHCEFARMDQGHLSGNTTNGMVIENCYFTESNLVPGSSDTSGGMKFTRAENAIIRNNVIEKLNAKVAAIWFDVYCVGVQIVNNSINAPGSHAYVFVELCHDFIVAGNTCFGGSQFGIWIFDSSKVRAWNNDVKQSTSWQIGIMQDDRRNDGSEGDARADAIARDNEAVNNIMAADYELFQIYAMDDYHTGYTPEYTAEQMWKRIEGNVMPRNTTRGTQVGWGRLGRQRESLTLEQLETRFPAVARNNRVPVHVPLPADIAAALGVPAGTVAAGPLSPAPVRA